MSEIYIPYCFKDLFRVDERNAVMSLIGYYRTHTLKDSSLDDFNNNMLRLALMNVGINTTDEIQKLFVSQEQFNTFDTPFNDICNKYMETNEEVYYKNCFGCEYYNSSARSKKDKGAGKEEHKELSPILIILAALIKNRDWVKELNVEGVNLKQVLKKNKLNRELFYAIRAINPSISDDLLYDEILSNMPQEVRNNNVLIAQINELLKYSVSEQEYLRALDVLEIGNPKYVQQSVLNEETNGQQAETNKSTVFMSGPDLNEESLSETDKLIDASQDTSIKISANLIQVTQESTQDDAADEECLCNINTNNSEGKKTRGITGYEFNNRLEESNTSNKFYPSIKNFGDIITIEDFNSISSCLELQGMCSIQYCKDTNSIFIVREMNKDSAYTYNIFCKELVKDILFLFRKKCVIKIVPSIIPFGEILSPNCLSIRSVYDKSLSSYFLKKILLYSDIYYDDNGNVREEHNATNSLNENLLEYGCSLIAKYKNEKSNKKKLIEKEFFNLLLGDSVHASKQKKGDYSSVPFDYNIIFPLYNELTNISLFVANSNKNKYLFNFNIKASLLNEVGELSYDYTNMPFWSSEIILPVKKWLAERVLACMAGAQLTKRGFVFINNFDRETLNIVCRADMYKSVYEMMNIWLCTSYMNYVNPSVMANIKMEVTEKVKM